MIFFFFSLPSMLFPCCFLAFSFYLPILSYSQVAALAKRVSEALENSGGHSDSSKGGIKSSSILMLGDGLEQWKDRLDEVLTVYCLLKSISSFGIRLL